MILRRWDLISSIGDVCLLVRLFSSIFPMCFFTFSMKHACCPCVFPMVFPWSSCFPVIFPMDFHSLPREFSHVFPQISGDFARPDRWWNPRLPSICRRSKPRWMRCRPCGEWGKRWEKLRGNSPGHGGNIGKMGWFMENDDCNGFWMEIWLENEVNSGV